MNPEATDLARRLVAHPSFAWAPGMGVADYGTVCEHCESTGIHPPDEDNIPDLDDPATAGVLLAMLAPLVEGQDLEITYAGVMRVPGRLTWEIDIDGRFLSQADCFGEALALALLAVWGDDRI